jgi:hypothetical protein
LPFTDESASVGMSLATSANKLTAALRIALAIELRMPSMPLSRTDATPPSAPP